MSRCQPCDLLCSHWRFTRLLRRSVKHLLHVPVQPWCRVALEESLLQRSLRVSEQMHSWTLCPKPGLHYYCLQNNCPINSSNLFCCNFPVQNYQINSRINLCCNFPCFIQNESQQKKLTNAEITELFPASRFYSSTPPISTSSTFQKELGGKCHQKVSDCCCERRSSSPLEFF